MWFFVVQSMRSNVLSLCLGCPCKVGQTSVSFSSNYGELLNRRREGPFRESYATAINQSKKGENGTYSV